MEPVTLEDGTQLDSKVVKVMRSIRSLESGGQTDPYNAVGDNGNAHGAYQFNEKTGMGWKQYAKTYLGDENAPMTPANQNKAMYGWIKEKKDAGLNPEEIDALHNGAHKDANGIYVHNDAERAKKFRESLIAPDADAAPQPQTIPQQRQELVEQGQPVSVNPEKAGPTKVGNILRGALRLPASIIASGANLVQTVQGKPETEVFHNNYLGDVKRVGSTFDPAHGLDKNNVTAIKDAAGKGLELVSYAVGGGAGSAVKEATLAGKVAQGALTASKTGVGAGALAGAGAGLQQDKSLGGIAAATGLGALSGGILGGIVGGALPILGKGANAVLGRGDKVLRDDAITNTTKALGLFGKKSGKIAMSEPVKMAEGLSVVRKYADDFDPANSENIFDDTLKAWTSARDKVFQKYDTVARQAGDNGVKIETKPLTSFLENFSKGITTAPKRARAQRLLAELKTNFPKGKATPLEMQNYIKLLNEELGGLTGGAEKGATGVTADFVKLAREHLDDAITKSTGKEYQAVRNEYGALKSVEDGLVRQYQKEMRRKGSGLTDYADMISNADVLSGIVSGNPALLVKGVATRVGAKFIKSLNDPATYLKDAFGAIDKIHERIALQARNVPVKAVDGIKIKGPSLTLPKK